MNFINEEIMLLNEGGAAGHLAHPFEDTDLTFGDMKEMINRGLIGGLDKEGPVTEKLDGQNIAFSVKDGKIVFARNKGHVRNRGENALDRNGIAKQFAGRGGIEKAFTGAAEDLEAAIKKLTPQQIKKMFGNGSKFMSLEVILPDTQNVIPYGKSVLVMHGTISYDKDGNEISRDTEEGREFGDSVKKVGADRQKTFGIAGAKSIVFSDADEKQNRKKANEYINDITRTAKQFGLSDKSKLEDYRRKWWDKELDNQEKKLGIKFSKSERNGLIKRWADGDKSFGVKNFDSDKKKNWFRKYEDSSLEKSQKMMIKPIENTFLKTGAHTLKRVTNFISSNNPKTAEQVKKDVITAIKAIKDSKDPAKLAKLQKELERLKEIGMDNVVPSEGLVFMYKGKPYKFTGAFAPINQITGTFKFDMPKEEMKSQPKEKQKYEKETKTDRKKVSGQPKKTVAVFVGRFQPFHAGHYSVYENLVKRFGKENVYIGSSDVTDDIRSPFRFSEKKEIITKMFGVPSSNVVKVKNPYQPTEILDKVGEDATYVTAVSQKDAERLDKGGKYFKNYDKTPTGKHKKYKDEGYYIIAPEMQLKVNGANISGTQLRATFGNQLLTKSEKVNIFKQIYPKFDKDIYDKIVQKTTKAEQAKLQKDKKEKQKSGKQQELPKGKKTTQTLDKHTTKKLKSVLNKKIVNPDTGNKIYIKSALKYDKGNKARKAAEDEIKKALKNRNENFPGGVFTGLTSPAGYINGAPDPDDVKKMRKKLNKDESVNSLFSSILTEEAFENWAGEYFSEHYVSSTGMFNRNLTVQQKIDKLNPARAKQKAKIWHKTFSHHNPDTGETENEEDSKNTLDEKNAQSDAQKQGLVHLGGGYYAKKQGEPATHKSEDGKIVKLSPEEEKELQAKTAADKGKEKKPDTEKPKLGTEPEKEQEKNPQQLSGDELKLDAEKEVEKKKELEIEKATKKPASEMTDDEANQQIEHETHDLDDGEKAAYKFLEGIPAEERAEAIDQALSNRTFWEKFSQDTILGGFLKKKGEQFAQTGKGIFSFVRNGKLGVTKDCSGAPAGPHSKKSEETLTEAPKDRQKYLASLGKDGKPQNKKQEPKDKSNCKDVHYTDYMKRDKNGKPQYETKTEPVYKTGKKPDPSKKRNSFGGKFTQEDIDAKTGFYYRDGKYYDQNEKEVDKAGKLLGKDGSPIQSKTLLGKPKTRKVKNPVYEDGLTDEQLHAAHDSHHASHEQGHAIKHTALEIGIIAAGVLTGGAASAAGKAAIAKTTGAKAFGSTQTTVHGASHGASEIIKHTIKDIAKHSALDMMGIESAPAAGATGSGLTFATGGVLENKKIINEILVLLEEGNSREKNVVIFEKLVRATLEKMKNFQMTPQQKLQSLRDYKSNKKVKSEKDDEKNVKDILNMLSESDLTKSRVQQIDDFVNWASNRLKLKEKPKLQLANTKDFSESNISLGGYNPETKAIVVATEGRLVADIIRTVAHEMVHRKQDEIGLIKNPIEDGATGSPIENQANAVAGILLRDYGKINKKIYTESKQIFNEAIIDDKFDSIIGDIKDELNKKYKSLQSVKYDTHDKIYTFVFSDEKEANKFRVEFQGTDSQNAQFDKIDYEPKQEPKLFFVKFKTQFKEDVNLPVNVGDTVLMGKFKNKKIKVKNIGKDDHNMPTINGRSAATFRIKKESLNEVSSLAGADAQPDGAFLPKGKTRILGKKDNVNKKDNWFTNGGYVQTDYPTADPIFGDEDAELVTIWYAHKNVPRTDSTIKTDFINESNFEKHTEKLLSIIQKK